MYPPEGFDVSSLLQNAQRMQQQFLDAQQDLADSEVVGSASGGLVRATVTGTGELVALDIDRTVVDPDDTETLADLIVAAVRDANTEVQRMASEQLGGISQGLGGPDLGGGGPDASALSDQLAGLLGGPPPAGQTGTEGTDESAESTELPNDLPGDNPGGTPGRA